MTGTPGHLEDTVANSFTAVSKRRSASALKRGSSLSFQTLLQKPAASRESPPFGPAAGQIRSILRRVKYTS
ncbi:unnamed protein product [Lota lota]